MAFSKGVSDRGYVGDDALRRGVVIRCRHGVLLATRPRGYHSAPAPQAASFCGWALLNGDGRDRRRSRSASPGRPGPASDSGSSPAAAGRNARAPPPSNAPGSAARRRASRRRSATGAPPGVEEAFGGRLGAVGAVAELRDIQIDLEDAPLRPEALDEQREVSLEALAEIAAAGPQIQILRHLLADGAGAAHAVAVLIELIGLLDGLDVEPPVLREISDPPRRPRRAADWARCARGPPTCGETRSSGRG